MDVATTGEEAVAQAQQSTPDLILMDLQLPGHRRTRSAGPAANTPGPATPVVALTASAMSMDRERALAAGFDGFLEKPINAHAPTRCDNISGTDDDPGEDPLSSWSWTTSR